MNTRSWRSGGEYGEYATGLYDSIVIAYVNESVPELTECTKFGVETPWKKDGHMVTDGISFYNFDKLKINPITNMADVEWCTAIDACVESYEFDCGRTSHWANVKYTNTHRKFAADWEHETVLVDLDGSLTGMGTPGYSVVPKQGVSMSKNLSFGVNIICRG